MKNFFYKNASWIFGLHGLLLVIFQYLLLNKVHVRLLIVHWLYLGLVGLVQIIGGILLGRSVRLLYIRANTDFLTGLHNRETFYKYLNSHIAVHTKNKKKMSLLIIDIDEFKRVNDRYGHVAGDKVLAALATLLQNEVRSNDILARIGGEEFAIILPSTSLENAEKIGERIKDRVQETIFPYQGKHLSISVGVSSTQTEASTYQLFQLADEALYRAKEKRNCVEIMEYV